MLGEVLGESRGKTVVRRVLSSSPPRIEVTFEDGCKLLGVDLKGFGTYTSEARPDGSLYGEGEGVYAGSGGEMVSWKGSGLGKFGEGGAVSYRGILYYRTTSEKLKKLNTVAGVFEHEVDGNGQVRSKIWEWK